MSGIIAYDDNDSACLRTYATLRIYSQDISPRVITDRLGVTPSRIWNKGSNETVVPRKQNGWFLSSRGEVESFDTKRHIDYILDSLGGNEDYIMELTSQGLQIDIMCLWQSAKKTEGGPSLLPVQMQKIGTMGIAVAWNIYIDHSK